MGSSTPFVEEINFSEIEIQEVVGKGSFGVVNKGKWRDKYVAIKMISSENERKAFLVELRQLSRVDHHNIVKLYGACQSKPVCLVMEYAEGGSLYNVLHGKPQPEYTAAHAISWALQCARGVAYLHGMKPKALIHRDLKPPNLLLIMGGTVLKICDFGTACDIQTHMTNNKGSAAWMAPEVFEGSSYSEKCDVFSWGIILWEVITRQKPFDDIRGSAYQILWAVHSGKRPPLVKGCPKPLNILMKRCWLKEPQGRPSMDEVVNIMAHLSVFFKGADQPIKYPATPTVGDENSDDEEDDDDSLTNCNSIDVTCGSECSSQVIPDTTGSSDQSTQKDTSSRKGSNETLAFNTSSLLMSREHRLSQTSAPASLASSKEDIRSDLELTLGSSYNIQKNQDKMQKRLSADVSALAITPKPTGHHVRSGSYGSNFVNPLPSATSETPTKPEDKRRNSEDLIHRGQRPYPNPNFPADLKPQLGTMPVLTNNWIESGANNNPPPPYKPSTDTAENAYWLLDPNLQPLSPYSGSKESMQLFEEHKKMAYEYLQVQTEFALLQQRKNELTKLLNRRDTSHGQADGNAIINEYDHLMQEKESLKKLHKNLKQQLAITRSQQQNRQ